MQLRHTGFNGAVCVEQSPRGVAFCTRIAILPDFGGHAFCIEPSGANPECSVDSDRQRMTVTTRFYRVHFGRFTTYHGNAVKPTASLKPPTDNGAPHPLQRFWPRRQRAVEALSFEHVDLPDDGQEFLKPTAAMLVEELRDAEPADRDRALAHFLEGDRLFKKRRYEEAARTYQVSGLTVATPSSLMAQGVVLMMVSDLRAGASAFHKAVKQAKLHHASRMEVASSVNLGQACGDLGEGKRAKRVLERALQLSQAIKDIPLELLSLVRLALNSFSLGEYHEGIQYCDHVLSIPHKLTSPLVRAKTLFAKAVILIGGGEIETVAPVLQEGARHAESARPSYVAVRVRALLASLHMLQGQMDEATNAANCALSMCRRLCNRQGEARCIGLLAVISQSAGHPTRGLEYFNNAVELTRQLQYRRGVARLHLEWAHFQLLQGNPKAARTAYQEAENTAGAIGHTALLLDSTCMATVLSDIGGEEKISRLQECAEISRSATLPAIEILVLRHIGSLYAAMGRLDEAISQLQMALQRSQRIGRRLEQGQVLVMLSRLAEQQGQQQLAVEYAGLAQALLHGLTPIGLGREYLEAQNTVPSSLLPTEDP